MPIELQVNLLRTLETGKITCLGGLGETSVDVRIIAAANRPPAQAIAQGKLREDLYFRLSMFPMHVPPLRSRPGDIKLLTGHFIDVLNHTGGVKKTLSPAAMAMIDSHHWPGNVREFKNSLQRAYILADSVIEAEHLIHLPQSQQKSERFELGVGMTLDELEKHLIFATLAHFDGDKRQAARTLGISLKTIYNRLKRYEGTDYSMAHE
jgi:DNA-binding NtrC family response regulator